MQLRLHAPLPIAALFACACGGETPRMVSLSLLSTYDATGVLRVLPEGLEATSFRELYATFDGLQTAGGRALASVVAKNGGTPIAMNGTFDAGTGQLQFEAASGALTSSASETVTELGGRGNERIQRDGVADEIVGFIETHVGREIRRGSYFAVARDDRRPPIPIQERISIRTDEVGKVRVVGQPGAVSSSAGVEIFRFQLKREAPPEFTLAKVMSNGSFSIAIAGLPSDVFLIRARIAGVASDCRFVRVTQ